MDRGVKVVGGVPDDDNTDETVATDEAPPPPPGSARTSGRARQALGRMPGGLRAGLWLKVEASRRRNDPRKATCGR